MTIETSLYKVALRFEGLKEIPGQSDHPFIQWCLSLTSVPSPHHDEIPWCSAFLNGLCYILGLQRSGSAAARSWLIVGAPVDKDNALVGQDIVVISRGDNLQAGHVGVFAGYEGDSVKILGGNQGDMVCVRPFKKSSILGIRRL